MGGVQVQAVSRVSCVFLTTREARIHENITKLQNTAHYSRFHKLAYGIILI